MFTILSWFIVNIVLLELAGFEPKSSACGAKSSTTAPGGH